MQLEWIEDDENMHGYMLLKDGEAVGSVRNMGRLSGDNKLWRATHYGHGQTMAYNFREAKDALSAAVTGSADPAPQLYPPDNGGS